MHVPARRVLLAHLLRSQNILSLQRLAGEEQRLYICEYPSQMQLKPPICNTRLWVQYINGAPACWICSHKELALMKYSDLLPHRLDPYFLRHYVRPFESPVAAGCVKVNVNKCDFKASWTVSEKMPPRCQWQYVFAIAAVSWKTLFAEWRESFFKPNILYGESKIIGDLNAYINTIQS